MERTANLIRYFSAVLLTGTFLVAAPSAEAAISSVFTGAQTSPAGGIPCTVQADGIRLCNASPRSTVKTFDGVPIDVNVMFPAEPASGPDGNYPVVGIFPSWGQPKIGLNANSRRWLDRGYAVFTMTDRGWFQSCGLPAARSADPTGCAAGYSRLMDTRYEVRDAQYLLGLLVDEDLINPQQIAATGGSYGGGKTLALGVLRNRVMLPDGTLTGWESPGGVPMELAAAAPGAGWTDLAQSEVPNGSTLDYVAETSYFGPQQRIGVLKQKQMTEQYRLGLPPPIGNGFYAPPGADPDADFHSWYALLSGGGPYDEDLLAQDFVDEVTTHHSAYYIPGSVAPAPMLISNGWNDDIFPVDEGVRLYNLVRARHPGAPIMLFDSDSGHARGQGKAADVAQLEARRIAWFDYYVRGIGSEPADAVGGVDAMTTTCPFSTPSAGPFHADSWADLAQGEIRFRSTPKHTIAATGSLFGDVFIGATGQSYPDAPCGTAPAADNLATANYRLDPAPAGGFTLLGSPTVIANFTLTGKNDQVAARLLDVDTEADTERLIARGLWRPQVSDESVRQVFQLHPQAYRVEPGHVLKLELLPDDAPYGLANPASPEAAAQHSVTVGNLELRLPVLEQPCSLGGLVDDPAPKLVPAGYKLAVDVDQGTASTKC